MNKFGFIAIASIVGGSLLMSCKQKENKLETFPARVAEMVKGNQVDSLKKYYPDMKFDSLAFAGPYENVQVGEISEGQPVKVSFGDGAWIMVRENEAGDISIVDSYGLAGISPEQREFAESTGILKDCNSDNQVVEALNDEGFREFIKKEAELQQRDNLTLKAGKSKAKWSRYAEGAESVTMPVTVTNNSSSPVDGNSYKITYTASYETCSDGSSPDQKEKKSQKGVDLAPGESKTVNLTTRYAYKITAPKIVSDNSQKEATPAFKGNGDEYSRYKAAK